MTVKLNDYLYSGDTVLRIIQKYARDLRNEARKTGNEIDMTHSEFLRGMASFLVHNDFLTSQSQRIREFYKYMAKEYPYLAFTFKGRIKSLIRVEEKFNGYIVTNIYDGYVRNGKAPSVQELQADVARLKDLIAYRIVISMPKCHLKPGQNRELVETQYLYQIANALPDFLAERGFTPMLSGIEQEHYSTRLDKPLRPYYRDYLVNVKDFGYRSLHITLYDNMAGCYVEVQLRTKEMDDYAEIGNANHVDYEKRQNREREQRDMVPEGANVYFDDAYERNKALTSLDLSKVDVNMFAAINNHLINDGCGLYRGRLILPYEHLSRFQNDEVD